MIQTNARFLYDIMHDYELPIHPKVVHLSIACLPYCWIILSWVGKTVLKSNCGYLSVNAFLIDWSSLSNKPKYFAASSSNSVYKPQDISLSLYTRVPSQSLNIE